MNRITEARPNTTTCKDSQLDAFQDLKIFLMRKNCRSKDKSVRRTWLVVGQVSDNTACSVYLGTLCQI